MIYTAPTSVSKILVGARTVTTAINDEANSDSKPTASCDLPNRTHMRPPLTKPKALIAYNNRKAGIDFSDQVASYAATLKKGVKWFRKLGIELLLNMTIANALVLFQTSHGRKINIRNFKESICESMLQPDA